MTAKWNDREVVFADFDIAAGREVRKAFAEDHEKGAFVLLSKSCRYADTNDLVFPTLGDIEAQPYRLMPRIMQLAGLAADANALEEVDPANPT